MQKLTGYELEFTAGNGGGPGATYETAMLTEFKFFDWPGAGRVASGCILRAGRLRSRLSSDCNTIVRLNSAQVGMIGGDG